MKFDNLSPELQQKVEGCQTPEDVLELAKAEGFELSDRDLEQIAGGSWGDSSDSCPKGGAHDYAFQGRDASSGFSIYRCTKCGELEIRYR